MPSLGAPELILIALVILLLFGATRLPKLGRSMGQSISGFKKGLGDDSDEDILEAELTLRETRKDEASEQPQTDV